MNESFTITEDLYATKGQRFANYIIDFIITSAVGFLIGFVVVWIDEFTGDYTLSNSIATMSTIEEYIFGYTISFIYFSIIESITQRSLGKYATNTKVVVLSAEKPEVKDILLRSLCRMIPFDAFSFLGDSGRGWHDSLSNTYVVDIKKLKERQTLKTEIDLIGQDLKD